jgi:predicted DsbA family dithiol-disulfide isomerase
VKKSKYPRLRAKSYKTVGGRVLTYYVYDMRGTGEKDVRLGADYAQALEKWHQLSQHIPLSVGRVQEAIDKWRAEILPSYTSDNTRAQYRSYLKNIESAFGQMAWHEIELHTLQIYLDRRSAKVSANRELSVLAVVWGQARKWGMTKETYPARGLSKFKNAEKPRTVEVTDDMFEAIYAHADRVLRDAMDIATATGMRITDVRTILMRVNGMLRFKASKTGKWAEFQVSQSPVLSAMVQRREAMGVHCVMLLATDTGRQVSEWMLCESRWNQAKRAAIEAHPYLADDLAGLYLRDLRKRAADLADDMESASKLLQHSTTKMTEIHYRTKPTKLKAVR